MGAMTGLLLLLWAGVTVGSVLDLQKRVIGGKPCDSKERLYHVQLRETKPADGFVCGGSLIGPQWVLTAAHCWEDSLYAVVGVHPGGSKEKRKVLNHHQFKDHDIMLLEIETPTNIHPVVQLPDCTQRPKVGVDEVQVAGHGATTTGPNKKRVMVESKTLQCANADVVDCAEVRKCTEKNFPDFWKSYKDQHWFCAQRKDVDISVGDSGGGVVVKNMIYGVISFLGDTIHACVVAFASMDVCHEDYLKWIKETIKPKKG